MFSKAISEAFQLQFAPIETRRFRVFFNGKKNIPKILNWYIDYFT